MLPITLTSLTSGGIKLYQLCDSMTGYCWKFKIATGESVSTQSLVLDLLSNSVAVESSMNNRRGLPKNLINKQLEKGEMSACRHVAIMALKWRDYSNFFKAKLFNESAININSKADSNILYLLKDILLEFSKS